MELWEECRFCVPYVFLPTFVGATLYVIFGNENTYIYLLNSAYNVRMAVCEWKVSLHMCQQECGSPLNAKWVPECLGLHVSLEFMFHFLCTGEAGGSGESVVLCYSLPPDRQL